MAGHAPDNISSQYGSDVTTEPVPVCDYGNFSALKQTNIQMNTSHCETPYYLPHDSSFTPYTVTVYGFVSPVLVLFTMVTNIIVCVVLLRKNMRSATNTMLAAMAFSDMLTGVWPIPCFLYFYTFSHYRDYVPFSWCPIYDHLFETLPTICHTASIWLTVALAVQRYIYVCHSLRAKRWCTIPNVLKVVVGIYIVAILSQASRFFDRSYVPLRVESLQQPEHYFETCIIQMRFEGYIDVYFNSYFWFRIIFIHLLPCCTLVILNALLIAAMRQAQKRREQLLRQNRRSECRRMKESNCTTLMLVAVVGLFLLVEFPLAILLILSVIDNTFFDAPLFDANFDAASLFINFCILLSYPLNFFIYCGMSRQFRDTFKRLFIVGAAPPDREHSQYISLATENGGGKTEVNDTRQLTATTTI